MICSRGLIYPSITCSLSGKKRKFHERNLEWCRDHVILVGMVLALGGAGFAAKAVIISDTMRATGRDQVGIE